MVKLLRILQCGPPFESAQVLGWRMRVQQRRPARVEPVES